jgi:[NiFe] hydrogenase diaphorase moiety small subunit
LLIMSEIVKFNIDGVECMAKKGTYLVDAARENGIYIPTLCNIPGVKPQGSCRICNVKVNNKFMTSCTTTVADGMEIENKTDEIEEIRKTILELLFVEGNHLCPSCDRSGNCELQALAYRYRITVPRFPYQFNVRNLDAMHPYIIKDHNRCIQCKRCIRAIKDEKGKNIFAFKLRGRGVEINIDPDLAHELTEELAQKAVDACPVGSILRRDKGFVIPIGERKYDTNPIGSNIEHT